MTTEAHDSSARKAAVRLVPLEEAHGEALCALWNRELGTAFPLSLRLLRQNSFGAFPCLPAASWVAEDAATNAPVGFVIGKLAAPGTGHVSLLLVAGAHRRQGIGRALLARCEQGLRSAGARALEAGREPGHYMPGVPGDAYALKHLLERCGYGLGETAYDLAADFAAAPPTARPDHAGLTCSTLEPATEADAFVAFLRRHFAGRWADSAEACLHAGSDGREFVLLRLRGELIGFCRVNDEHSPRLAANVYWNGVFPPGTSGGIGPLGIAEAHRGQGYGLAAVQAGVHVLRARGYRTIVIDWTTHLDFYAKLGFRPWRSYDAYRKP
ncbi:GNAT family N-acetyltransferase [Paenibacillus sp. HJGM_3]|uniref:GNAT family N-acetyltransferase n=1 Tax=Paenibacillus sp. HJGM_3 TaxID=3379816 RepID=UPI00385F88C6